MYYLLYLFIVTHGLVAYHIYKYVQFRKHIRKIAQVNSSARRTLTTRNTKS